MEGKLIKRDDDYKLFVNDATFAQSKKSPYKKLSLKNCQAIERGYDLDEVAKLSYECDPYIAEYLEQEFKRGFQKALEILGDKKFSEEDILKAIAFGWDYEGRPKEEMLEIYNINLEYNNSYFEDTKKYIQSLQQTEWDVSIEMEPYHDGDFINDGKTHIIEAKLRPRLDSDGCLILKRK